jgi:hypothetical protein
MMSEGLSEQDPMPRDVQDKQQHVAMQEQDHPSGTKAPTGAMLKIKYRGPVLFAVMVSYGIFACTWTPANAGIVPTRGAR